MSWTLVSQWKIMSLTIYAEKVREQHKSHTEVGKLVTAVVLWQYCHRWQRGRRRGNENANVNVVKMRLLLFVE